MKHLKNIRFQGFNPHFRDKNGALRLNSSLHETIGNFGLLVTVLDIRFFRQKRSSNTKFRPFFANYLNHYGQIAWSYPKPLPLSF
jgi:methyltransferase-like protein